MSSQPGQNKGEMPIAEVVHLTDLVNYQDGSVVSRTIVKRPTGTVTLFAFDEDQGLSEHTAAFDAMAHILESDAIREITLYSSGYAVHHGNRPVKRKRSMQEFARRECLWSSSGAA